MRIEYFCVYKTRLNSRAHLESFLRQKPDIRAQREGLAANLAKKFKIIWRVKTKKITTKNLFKIVIY